MRMRTHTEVVLTPHSSNFSNVGVGALGVSMNSNSLSEPLTLCVLEDMIAASSIGIKRRNLDNSTSTRFCLCLRHLLVNVEEMCGRRSTKKLVQEEVTDFPHQSTSRTKARLNTFHYHHKKRDKFLKSKTINAVVDAIRKGEFIDYSNIAKYFKYSRTTVSRYIRGLSKTKKKLTPSGTSTLLLSKRRFLFIELIILRIGQNLLLVILSRT
jgi:hypothetical protein